MFGHEFKKKHFPLSANSFTPVNHGSFGLPPQCVVDKYIEAFEEDIKSPDFFYGATLRKQYEEGLHLIAKVVNCNYKHLALVTNATIGVNTILRSLKFARGDKILMPSSTYRACMNTVIFLQEYMGIEAVVVELVFPMLHAEILTRFREVLANQKIKLALFDAVVSVPGVRLPFEEITALCRQYGALSLVDGAHLVGLIPVDLAFRPDFYVSNLHKWLSVPRGCAVLYVDPKHHLHIQTMPISHSYVSPSAELSPVQKENLLVDKFFFTGSENKAAIATIPEAVRFRNETCGGEDKIREYCFRMARAAADLCLEKWPGTELIENKERTLATALVSLYVPYTHSDLSVKENAAHLIAHVTSTMLYEHRTFVHLGMHANRLTIRFSGQIYNEISDYEYAIDAVKSSVLAYIQAAKL